MDKADVGADVFIFAREDDGEFCFILDGGVDKAASDADDTRVVEERVVGDKRRIFHRQLFCGVRVEYFLLFEISPFFCEGGFLYCSEDGIFCVAKFEDGYG